MNYNYTDAPFYANTVETELVVDGTIHVNLVIEKQVISQEHPYNTTTTFYTYNVSGLTITEVDQFTRTKIQELNV
jgi:hypothetical protein